MVKPWELFNIIYNAKYTKIGDDLDYTIQEIDGRVVLLFQETTTKRDWRNNFKFPRKVYKDQKRPLKIHSGYGDVWRTGNDQIMQELIEAVAKNGMPPYIAGWSFGGAMALLAAEDYNYRTGNYAQVITFGAPKVAGNRATKKTIQLCGLFTQYAVRNDIVPLCPPLPGFHHIRKVSIGEAFNLFKAVKAEEQHTSYGQEELYND